MDTTTKARVHDAQQVCPNTDPSVSLAGPFDAIDYPNPLDRGDQFCGLCECRFTDPEHGIAKACGRKTRHVCRVVPA